MTNYTKFELALESMLPRYKNTFVGKENDCFKRQHGKVNNTPVILYLQTFEATGDIWDRYLRLGTIRNSETKVKHIALAG